MEDTKSLLMMVLHKIFENQPKIVENTFQLVHNYNNGKIEKINYEKVLKMICDMMSDKLPSPILVYLLTLVDIPQCDIQSSIIEKMRKTHDCLPEINVRPYLLDYLNNLKPSNQKNKLSNTENKKNEKCLKSRTRVTKKSVFPENTKTLQDLCLQFIIANENFLKLSNKKKLENAWKFINNEIFIGNDLEQCYKVVRYLNKIAKLLRGIENDNITSDLIMEDCDVFLKEKGRFQDIQRDPFTISADLENAIRLFK